MYSPFPLFSFMFCMNIPPMLQCPKQATVTQHIPKKIMKRRRSILQQTPNHLYYKESNDLLKSGGLNLRHAILVLTQSLQSNILRSSLAIFIEDQ